MTDRAVQNRIGVLGATSFVGTCLLRQLSAAGRPVIAFTRRPPARLAEGVVWRQLALAASPQTLHSPPVDSVKPLLGPGGDGNVPWWICYAPIWVLPDYFSLLDAQGVRRVVVLSSTSRFTKHESSNPDEQALALKFADAEARLCAWAESRGVEWVILRPTLIYGLGRDKNISEIARLIRRFGFFPLLGKAGGRRQPIHAADVADACLAALQRICAANRAYNISGGETLTYREMVSRIFTSLGRHPRFFNVPSWGFHLLVSIMRHLPRYRKLTVAMAERMNADLVFDHSEATRDLGFAPRAFVLGEEDLPP